MKEELMMARIRDAEHGQLIAELTQKVSRVELKVSLIFLTYLTQFVQFEVSVPSKLLPNYPIETPVCCVISQVSFYS